jgi:hypothetical protein
MFAMLWTSQYRLFAAVSLAPIFFMVQREILEANLLDLDMRHCKDKVVVIGLKEFRVEGEVYT